MKFRTNDQELNSSYCFFANKGGVGKTTLVLHSACALSMAGFRVLVIDLDGQADLTQHLSSNSINGDITDLFWGRSMVYDVISPTKYDNLDIVCGSHDLDFLPHVHSNIKNEPFRLREALKRVQDKYDYILIDCSSAINWATRMAMYASGKVIVPIQPEAYALKSLKTLSMWMSKKLGFVNIHKIVVNMYRNQTQLHKNLVQDLQHTYGDLVAKQKIKQTIALASAAHMGESLFQFAPTTPGALELFSLSWELFDMNERSENKQLKQQTFCNKEI